MASHYLSVLSRGVIRDSYLFSWILYYYRNDEHPHYAIITLLFFIMNKFDGFSLLFNTLPSTFFNYKQICFIICLSSLQLFYIKCFLKEVGRTLNLTFPPPGFDVILHIKFFNGLANWLINDVEFILLYFQNLYTPNFTTFYYLRNTSLP